MIQPSFRFRTPLLAALALAGATSDLALTPLERSFNHLWALNYDGTPASVCLKLLDASGTCPGSQISGVAGSGINAPQGWDRFVSSGQEVVIALLDSGIDTRHLDLAGRLWVNPGESNAQGQCVPDGLDNDNNGYVDDCHGANALAMVGSKGAGLDGVGSPDVGQHGTQMSGAMTAAANNNLSGTDGGGVVGVAGLAPNVKVVTCAVFEKKQLGEVSSLPSSQEILAALPENVVRCANYFTALKDRGINIVVANVSGGVSVNSNIGNILSPVTNTAYLMDRADIRQAIADLEARDILVVAAAGNNAWDVDNQVNTSIPQPNRAYYPASFGNGNIISVAATNIGQKLGVTSLTSWGRYSVDVGAPGDDILTTSPDDAYATVSGSSPAAAFVSGLVASIKANASTSGLSGAAVRRLLLSSGQPLEALKHTTSSGKLVRLDAALSCSGKAFKRRQWPANDAVAVLAGQSIRMEVQNYVCASPSTATSIAVKDLITNSTMFSLYDNGLNGDAKAGDGVYSATWTPPSTKIYRLSFGTDTVTGVPDVLTVNPDTQTVDNGSSQGLAGTWSLGVGSAPFVGVHYLFTKQTTPVARQWSFNVQRAGRYKVSATWPIDKAGNLFADKAQYVISSPGKPSVVVARDQRAGGGAWSALATLDLAVGTHTVTLKNTQHTDASGDVEPVISVGQIVADAVRLDRESN